MKHSALGLFLPISLVFFLGACGNKQSSEVVSNIASVENSPPAETPALISKYNLNKYPINKLVCDPLTGGGFTDSTKVELGLKAQLYTALPGQRYYKANDYVEKGIKSSQNLFFSDLNVPTRMFTEGFANPLTGGFVKSDAGDKLIEFFAIKFESHLRLAPDMEEGNYQLALLSDDGSVLKLKINNEWKTIINNDGDHPTRMGCAVDVVELKKDTLLSLEASYYQGPRYHISNVLMWRKVSSNELDPACGVTGNSTFFNPNNNSTPTALMNTIWGRGWQVVPRESFVLSTVEDFNPCVTGTVPIISGFSVYEVFSNEALITWTTDIPSSSQIRIINVATGEESLTPADNILRTRHDLTITGLTPATEYRIQAISISEDLGKALSSEILLTTAE